MRICLLIILLMASGCTTMDHNSIVSPSESLYYKANELYENGKYSAAIEKYTTFLETKPRSQLTTSASLNIGMSYYYQEDYKQAYYTLKDIKMKDENIKQYIDGIIETSKTNAKDEIEAEENSRIAAASEKTSTSYEIEIVIIDAYVDNFGSVILKGTVDEKSTIIIGSKKIPLNSNNTFSATTQWRKGNPILITAKGIDGGTGELDYFSDREPPEEPEGLRTLNITSNSIEVEWDENTENDIKGYRLYYRRLGGSLHEIPELITGTRYDVVGLSGGSSTIQFYIRAVDKMNNESYDSDILQADLL